jgi:hypothetical protein
MDDFRSQLRDLIESLQAEGVTPAFLVVDLQGADEIKRVQGIESMERFKDGAIRAVVSAANGADAFTYGDDRVVAVLGPEWDRLKTFALIQKLRRVVPMLGQSFDCYIAPAFDVVEYDPAAGFSGLITALTQRRRSEDVA